MDQTSDQPPADPPRSAISCTDLGFRYGRRQVLRGVTKQFGPGVTGILGPNGAGKSTLIRCLATALKPSEGELFFDGISLGALDRQRVRRVIGYLPQRFSLMPWATAQRNVAYAAWAQGIAPKACSEAAAEALRVVGLTREASSRVRTLSGGQQQRVGIACAIAHSPRVVLLDEPTAGLDAERRARFKDHLGAIARSTTVIMSTHIIDDLEGSAHDVLVLTEGVSAFSGRLENLRDAAGLSDGEKLEVAYIEVLKTFSSRRMNAA